MPDRETLGALAAKYLLEPAERLHRESGHDVLAIIAPPPHPEGAAIIMTTAIESDVTNVLVQAIVAHERAKGRRVIVSIQDVGPDRPRT